MIAHIREDGKIQTVQEHLTAVSDLAAKKGAEIGLEETMRLAGLLHDVGKNTQAFQEYIIKATENPASVRRGEINHSSAGGCYIYERYKAPTERLAAQLISLIIVSHHGCTDCLSAEGIEKYLLRVCPKAEIGYDEAVCNSENIINEYNIDILFAKAVKEVDKAVQTIGSIAMEMSQSDGENPHFLMGCLERLMLSILIDADRLDTAAFMGSASYENHNSVDTHEFWKDSQRKLTTYLSKFSNKSALAVLRNGMSEECFQFADRPGGIYCLPIPTGGGKTLCSLRYALEHAIKLHKDRIFYIAPFLSILEQNAGVIREVLQKEEYILEHHSNMIIDNQDTEVLSKYQLLTETWVSPVILTTMIQFLNVCFRGNTQSVRRMNQLRNAVIIIDEIQSLPVKCIHMFNSMMNFLSYYCHTTVILCSATQPLLGKVKRKILYGSPVNMIANVPMLSEKFKRVEIVNRIIRGGYSGEQLADFVLEEFDKNVLVILNTKAAVKKVVECLGKRISTDIYLVQLTTYMCAQHRSDIISELKEQMPDKRIICISTQLIEAGVDISFQTVIRSFTGLDSIVQAAGRCNRNGEVNRGLVYIVNMKDDEEHLSQLPDIQCAQNAMRKTLGNLEAGCGGAEVDLLRQETQDLYYDIYFFDRLSEMDYSVKNGIRLYDLLSVNQQGTREFTHRISAEKTDKAVKKLCLKQAFKQAGEWFEVIGNNTIGLIVPYKDAKESISKVRNCDDFAVIKQELKKLQRYTVNMYENESMIKKLCQRKAIDFSMLEHNIYILEEGFYNAKEGINDQLEVMIF